MRETNVPENNIVKQLFVILITVGILLQSFSKVFILCNFQANRDYISKNLCVKKEIKNNTCNGKCHLKKQLKEDEKKEKAPAGFLKDLSEVLYLGNNSLPLNLNTVEATETVHPPYKSGDLNSLSLIIFHPPKL